MIANPSPSSTPHETLTATSLGAGIILVKDTDLHLRFAPYGMSISQFRKWRRALGCPAMVMPNGDELVDLHSFRIAIKLVLQFGAPDFFAPGNKYTRKGLQAGRKGRREITHDDYIAHWREVMADLLAARKEDYALNTAEVRSSLEGAAERVSLFLAQLTGKAREEALKEANRLASTLDIDTPASIESTDAADHPPFPSAS